MRCFWIFIILYFFEIIFSGQRLTLLEFSCWKLFLPGFAHSHGFLKTNNIKGIIEHLLRYFGSHF